MFHIPLCPHVSPLSLLPLLLLILASWNLYECRWCVRPTVGPRSRCLSQSALISPCSLILPPPTEHSSAFAPFFFLLFFCNSKQAGVKGCDVSHLILRTPHRVALIRLPAGVLIVRFSVLSFALTHFVPEAGYKWEIASGAVISRW